ncbi:hypothetical protein [Mammaliicoccus vitulinus]|uniref:hypothetical protein n=1 Tax=Mammaliicoccus vitulinus TaxID=71237 RepID=UPI00248B05A0|nr:hypothetical protein [Mammaliicoccus vitulinus]
MSASENFKDYPKILKIENDGKIIALDQNGNINTDLNTHTINDEKQKLVFGQILYSPYSRTEKNKNDYNENNKNAENYYNQRDREREWQLQDEKKQAKTKNKWLGFLLTIAIVVIAFLVIKGTLFNNNQNENVTDNEQLQQSNQQLQQDMNNTKNKLKDSQANEQQTQQDINNLQNKIDDLKTNNQDNQNNGTLNSYQDGINQLQEAQNSKTNGNYEQAKEKVKDLDQYFDKEEITDKGKSQWNKFKSWLEDNNPF